MESELLVPDLADYMDKNDVIRGYIADIEKLSHFARRYTIRAWNDMKLPAFVPGSNIEVRVPAKPGDKPSPYSITSSPDETDYYQIIVVNNQTRKGGKNDWLNTRTIIGDELELSMPRQGLRFSDDPESYFIAAGSGIAAFISHLNTVDLAQRRYHVDHIVRDRNDLFTYIDHESSRYLDLETFITSEIPSFSLENVLSDKDIEKPLHISGSEKFILDVINAAVDTGWVMNNLHWDRHALSYDMVKGSGRIIH